MNPYIRKIVELHKIHKALENKSNSEGGGDAVSKDYYDFNDKNDTLEFSKILFKSIGKQQQNVPDEVIESIIENMIIADNPTKNVINYIRYNNINTIRKSDSPGVKVTIIADDNLFEGCSILFSDANGIYVIPDSIGEAVQ